MSPPSSEFSTSAASADALARARRLGGRARRFARLTTMRRAIACLAAGLVLAHCAIAVATDATSAAEATPPAAPAPLARLSPELRDRFAAGLASLRAGDAAKAGREFADPVWATTPLPEYAALFLAQSLLKTGDTAGTRAAAARAVDAAPEGRPVPS